MNNKWREFLQTEIQKIKDSGLYKNERIITTPQNTLIKTKEQGQVINLCANNYLGLANHPDLVAAAHEALDHYGYGMSSVRFICGTQQIHKELESEISHYLNMEDCVLYSSCFDANGGLFECLLDEKDAILSDALNHASIIDGIRLCKAQRFRYQNNDMNDLEQKLKEAANCRYKLIVTDGVFSMDGSFANLKEITNLASRYEASLMVDDSHAVGFIGKTGRGTPEYFGVSDKVDILTGTLGKALGGASGGYTATKKEIAELLRQRSRPYLFSNTVAPVIVATSIRALQLLNDDLYLKQKLQDNSDFFRKGLTHLGFELIPGSHPIIPIMLHDAHIATEMADALLKQGIYVIAFSYPVVPINQARIRTQMSANHTMEQLTEALEAFKKVGKQLKVIA